MPGAREMSAEEIVLEMRRNGDCMPSRTAGLGRRGRDGAAACSAAGAGRARIRPRRGDVLDDAARARAVPRRRRGAGARAPRRSRELAAQGARAGARRWARCAGRGAEAGASQQIVDGAARHLSHAVGDGAADAGSKSVAPGERTFMRPSRRGADRTDVVLPGRKREGWMLNVVLDTSGSMTDEIPRALGAIADFCDAVGGRPDPAGAVRHRGDVRRGAVARRARRLPDQRLRRQRPDARDARRWPTIRASPPRSSSPTATSPIRPSRCRTPCCGCCRRAAARRSPPYGRVVTMQQGERR